MHTPENQINLPLFSQFFGVHLPIAQAHGHRLSVGVLNGRLFPY